MECSATLPPAPMLYLMRDRAVLSKSSSFYGQNLLLQILIDSSLPKAEQREWTRRNRQLAYTSNSNSVVIDIQLLAN